MAAEELTSSGVYTDDVHTGTLSSILVDDRINYGGLSKVGDKWCEEGSISLRNHRADYE